MAEEIEQHYLRRMSFALAEIEIRSLFEELTLELLLSKASESPLRMWILGDIESIEYEDRDYIFGRLIKLQRGVKVTQFDEKTKGITRKKYEIPRAYYSNFVAHRLASHKYSLAAEETAKIKIEQFRSKFAQLLTSVTPTEVETPEFIVEPTDIRSVLGTLSSLSSATFNLRPSNPSSYDVFRRLDGLIQESKADSARIDVKGGKEGLDSNAGVVLEGTAMAEEGYGTAKYVGERDLRTVSISLSDRIVRYVGKIKDIPLEVVKAVHSLLVRRDDTKSS